MFDSLAEKLQGTLSQVRNRGTLTEQDIDAAMREIRLALLEADVNFKVAREFTAQLKQRCLGAEVIGGLNPGQQVVKIVAEELTALMGGETDELSFAPRPPTVILQAAKQGLERASTDRLDTVIVDTAGRLQVDEVLMDELEHVRAALSVKTVTGRPIMFASTGEKLGQLEVFHPDRMASRILGMGDVLTLIERAEQAASEDETKRLEAQMRKGQFTFDDFLQAQKMLRRMGPLGGIMKMIPGMGQLADANIDEDRLKRVEAIVLSMTPRERSMPHTLDGQRRARIAAGAGVAVPEVNQLLEARKMMEKMMGQMSKGKMPSLPGMGNLGAMGDLGLGNGGPALGPGGVPPLERRHGAKKRKPGNKKRSGRR